MVVLAHHHVDVSLVYDIRAGVRAQGVVQWHHHERIRVACLLGENPLGTVLTIQAYEGLRARD